MPRTATLHFVSSDSRPRIRSTDASISLVCNSAACLLAALYWTLAITAVSQKSATFDEPIHLTAGYSYWLRHDFRLDPENGNLPQRWAALPLLLSRPRFVAENAPSWLAASHKATGQEFLYELGNNADDVMLQGRMMMALFGAALCLVIYFWSRELFGPLGGIISITLAAFSPTLLGNGALVTSDAAVALFMTASAWSFWRMLQRITLGRFAVCALVTGLAFVAKMSGPLVLPMMAIMSAVRLCSQRPLVIRMRGEHVVRDRWLRAICLAGIGLLAAVVVWLTIWSFYGFRYSALAEEQPFRAQLNQSWNGVLDNSGAFDSAVAFGRTHHFLPEAYLYGLAYVHHSAQRPAYLDGNYSLVGFRRFFPLAFLYKTTLPALGLLIIAAGFVLYSLGERSQWQKNKKLIYRGTALWSLLLVYGSFALTSRLNIGQRHLLPIYPALFIGCGVSAAFLRDRTRAWGALTLALLLGWHVTESLRIRPDYLAYFNQIAGGPDGGREHLVDSSLDWGQDLPALKDWLDQNQKGNPRPVFLAYFGTADPQWYGINATLIPQFADSRQVSTPFTGGIYCVSATTLAQVYSRAMGKWSAPYEKLFQKASIDRQRFAAFGSGRQGGFEPLRLARFCAALRHRKPLANAGHSILIFDLSDAEVDQAFSGPPAELIPEIAVAGLN